MPSTSLLNFMTGEGIHNLLLNCFGVRLESVREEYCCNAAFSRST